MEKTNNTELDLIKVWMGLPSEAYDLMDDLIHEDNMSICMMTKILTVKNNEELITVVRNIRRRLNKRMENAS